MKRTSKNRHEAGEVLPWAAGVTLGLILGAALLIVVPRVGQAQGNASPSQEGTIVSTTQEQSGAAGTEGGGGTGVVQGQASRNTGGATNPDASTGNTGNTEGAATQAGGEEPSGEEAQGSTAANTAGGGNPSTAIPEGARAQGAADRQNGPLSSGNRAEAAGTTDAVTNTSTGRSTGATAAQGEGPQNNSNPDTPSVAEQTGAANTVAPLAGSASAVARAEGTADDVNSFAKTGGQGSGLNQPGEIVDGNPATTGEGGLEANPDEIGGNPSSDPRQNDK